MESNIKSPNHLKAIMPYWGNKIMVWTKNGVLQDDHEGAALSTFAIQMLNSFTFKLILKPLSSISDEDAIKVFKLINPRSLFFEDWEKIIMVKDEWSENDLVLNSGIDNLFAFQYLISKGYDLPNYHLGCKTLFECGLAIYE